MRQLATLDGRRTARPVARRLAAGVLVAVLMAACGGDDTPAAASVAVDLGVGSLPTGDTSPTVPVEPVATTTPDTSPILVTTGPVQIDVVVGRDSGPDRIEQVAVGSDVTINITNPDAADEFHLHGIELERSVGAGVMATFNFTANTPGTYELESHETDGVLVVLVVG